MNGEQPNLHQSISTYDALIYILLAVPPVQVFESFVFGQVQWVMGRLFPQALQIHHHYSFLLPCRRRDSQSLRPSLGYGPRERPEAGYCMRGGSASTKRLLSEPRVALSTFMRLKSLVMPAEFSSVMSRFAAIT